jgi:hypothetical protein
MQCSGGTRLSVAVLSLSLALVALAAPAGAATGDPGGSRQQSLSIWAYFDGDTPVTGGTVHAYADGKELNSDGRGPVTTIPGGMAMLRFDSLPSALRIVVSGGHAGGERVLGSLRTKVRDVTDGEIVHVNPVTTVSDLLAHREEGPGLRHERDLTERTLGIRPILDDHDLWATDRWFGGDRFLRWALERGSVGAGARHLVHLIERPGFDQRQFDPPDGGGPEAGVATSADANAGNVLNGLLAAKPCVGAIASEVFNGMADGIVGATGLVGGQGFAVGLVVIVVKQLFGAAIEDCNKNAGQEEVLAQLKGIGAEITELKAHIDAKFLDLKVGDSLKTRDAITDTQDRFLEMVNYAKKMEDALSPPKAGDPPNKDRCTSETCMQAKNNLVQATSSFLTDARGLLKAPTAATTLNTALMDQTAPSKAGLISDVRESIGNERFFTSKSSQQIRDFFQFYEWKQTELATVLSEYYLLGGDCAQKFSERNSTKLLTGTDWNCPPLQPTAKTDVDKIKKNIANQRTMLPPKDLNPYVFIDRDTHRMWRREPEVRGNPAILDGGLKCASVPRDQSYQKCGASLVNNERNFHDRTGLYPSPLWDIPGADDYRALFADTDRYVNAVNGTKVSAVPLERLKQLGVSPGAGFFQGNPAGYLWLRGDFYVFGDDKGYTTGTGFPNVQIKALLFELRPGGPTNPNSKEFLIGNRCYNPAGSTWWQPVHPDCQTPFPNSGWNKFLAYIIWQRGPMSDAEGGDYWCEPGKTGSWNPKDC